MEGMAPMSGRDGKKLRRGYTTGSCAAAAAAASAELLFSGCMPDVVPLLTPSGELLVLRPERGSGPEKEGTASCFVRKDSGDDPDVTNGICVFADVRRTAAPGISIDGGEGVGRVTKPGLDRPVGDAAINTTPRRMIRAQVEKAAEKWQVDLSAEGVEVIIRIPGGRELAEKTFNPRLGITGGLSVLGTSGIVEPMSEAALTATIRAELSVKRAAGFDAAAAAPGNYGLTFLKDTYGLGPDLVVTASNFIRDTVVMAEEAGFRSFLLAGHIGKLIKVAGGVPNTHSRYGDGRMEILTALAKDCLAGGDIARMPDFSGCAVTDDAVRLLKEQALDGTVMAETVRRIRETAMGWTGGRMEVEVVMFSNRYGILGMTKGAEQLIWYILSERDRVQRT